MCDDAVTEGLQRKRIDGVEVPIFNPARTIVDCFKFRRKIGLDVALEGSKRCATAGRSAGSRRMNSGTTPHCARGQCDAGPYIEAITA
jgi:hypothetical protein